jgi:hypothetical protein
MILELISWITKGCLGSPRGATCDRNVKLTTDVGLV